MGSYYIPGMEDVVLPALALAAFAVGVWYVSRRVLKKARSTRRYHRRDGGMD